jgi:hypothetical protein
LAKEKPHPRLQQVTSIYVKGNNEAADKAREILRKAKTCFSLATNEVEGDAVLDVGQGGEQMPNDLSLAGGREDRVSFSLTLKSGDLLWSDSYKASGALGMGGAKSAADLLMHRLARAADCKKRK